MVGNQKGSTCHRPSESGSQRNVLVACDYGSRGPAKKCHLPLDFLSLVDSNLAHQYLDEEYRLFDGKGNCVEMGRHGRRTVGGSVTFNAHAIKREKKEICGVGNRHAYGKGHSSRLPRINSCKHGADV